MDMIETTIYSDPACPWAYSESPALRVIEWRYGDQLDWRLVLIGLTEDASQYERRGYTPLRGAVSQATFRRRYGMPFSPAPKDRLSATSRACRAVVAARIDNPGSEWRVFRALQLANFTSPLILDDDAQLAAALNQLEGIDGDALVARIDDPDVHEAYEADKLETRAAAGSAAELQGKTRVTDGPVRFTAPSVTFQQNGTRLVAGGFQPVEAYDILIANIDPTLTRQSPPEDPEPLLQRFPDGLTTQEVAALLAEGNDAPARDAAELALLELVASGRAIRQALGDDALWKPAA
jgi:2-hydroxychromene-2-carboxylate isomerase